MVLLTLVVAPIVGLISQFGFGIEPWPVGVVIFALGLGGLLRIAYAFMFGSKDDLSSRAVGKPVFERSPAISDLARINALPAPNSHSEMDNARTWSKSTNMDLQPPSVTDHTTKLLETDQDP
jgi:hypothetical protein